MSVFQIQHQLEPSEQLPVPSHEAEALSGHATIRTATSRQCVRSKLNVRRKGSSIEELAALIRSQGLLQNLVGYEQVFDGAATGVIEIVAGGRRLAAIGLNIERGDLPDDFLIPYLLVTEEEAVAISVAENFGREPMHPADVYEAMIALHAKGRSVEDIGLAFNLSPQRVKQRLKLGNISPRLLGLYRNDGASYEQMMALAISDDHKAQEQAWDALSGHRPAWEIKRMLTAQHINAQTDRLARFVGLETYEKAGGGVVRDLFSTADSGYLTDAALLERLALVKLERSRKALEREGHAWIEVVPRLDRTALAAFAKVRSVTDPLTPDQQAELSSISERLALLEQEIEARADAEEDRPDGEAGDPGRGGESPAAEEGRAPFALHAALMGRQREIRGSVASRPHPGDMALAGALIAVDEGGGLVLHRGLIRPEDVPRLAPLKETAGEAGRAKESAKRVHSDRLTRVLSAHRTVALRAELMERPDVAMVLLTRALVIDVFRMRQGANSSNLTVGRPPDFPDEAKDGKAWTAFEARRAQLMATLPAAPELLGWLFAQPQVVVMQLMAFCFACSVDMMVERDCSSPEFGELARAVELDMNNWWRPTAATYFNHVSKARAVEVVARAVSPQAATPLEQMRKGMAAEAAERALAGSTWLPEILRS